MTSLPQDPQSGVSSEATSLAIPDSTLPSEFGTSASPQVWLDSHADDEGIDVMGFVHSLRRRWLPGVLIGSVLATLAASLLWIMIPLNSEAVALLRVNMAEKQVLAGRSRSSNDHRSFEVYKQTQAALLTSPFVLQAAIRPPEIQALSIIKSAPDDKPIALLQNEINAGYPGDSEILSVSMSGDNGEELKKLVNAVVDAYVEEVAQAERNLNSERLNLLRAQHRKNIRDIQEMNTKIQQIAEEIGTSDSELARLNQRMKQAELHTLDRDLSILRNQYEELRGRLFVINQVRQSRFITPSPFEVEDMLESDPGYYKMKQSVNELERQMILYGDIARGTSPEVARMQAELGSMRQEVDRRKRELLPRIKHRLQKAYGNDENLDSISMQSLNAQAIVANERIIQKDKLYEEKLQEVRDLTGFSADLITRKAAVSSLQETTDTISQEISRLDLNMKQGPRVHPVQRAVIPDTTNKRLRNLEVAAAWLGTFLLSLIGVSAWDYFGKRLNSGKDLQSPALGLPLLGTLPSLRGNWLGSSANESVIADCVDTIRAAIHFGVKGKEVKSIIVTSALGHEGKTTVASQLAVSLARGGKRTLLLDGDIRNPQQHAVFGLPADRGFCDVLRGEAQLEEVVQATPAENLWILPAGRCDTVSYQALSGQGVGASIEKLTAQFDFVVIDSGPVLTGPESLIFGQYVDGAILSSRRDISRLTKINDAASRLRSVGVHIIGSVMNGVSADSRGRLPALTQE